MTSGDFSATLNLLSNPSSFSGPFWNHHDDSLLLSADPVARQQLQEKYSEEDLAKRVVFLEVEGWICTRCSNLHKCCVPSFIPWLLLLLINSLILPLFGYKIVLYILAWKYFIFFMTSVNCKINCFILYLFHYEIKVSLFMQCRKCVSVTGSICNITAILVHTLFYCSISKSK